MTTRRDTLLALPALSAALIAGAQTPKRGQPKRIGDLDIGVFPEKSDPNKPLESESRFWDAMRKKGWILGENVVIERAYANRNAERLTELAGELVRKRVDVLLPAGELEAVAAARATQTVPIIFFDIAWPVEIGLIDSFAKPGRNLTGSNVRVETITKRAQFLREIVPSAKRLSWLRGEPFSSTRTVAGDPFNPAPLIEAPLNAMGFETRFHVVRTQNDIADVFADITSWGAQAIATGGVPVWEARERLAGFGLRHRLPIAARHRSYVEAGALLSYGLPDSEQEELFDRFTAYVDRVLRGEKPADLPVIQPSRYELVINMKTAKALSLMIPQSVLQRADQLMQ